MSSIENVKEYLKQFGAADQVMEFTESSATVELVAKAVGVICQAGSPPGKAAA